MLRGISEVEVLSREGGLGGKERGEKGRAGRKCESARTSCFAAMPVIYVSHETLCGEEGYVHSLLNSFSLVPFQG